MKKTSIAFLFLVSTLLEAPEDVEYEEDDDEYDDEDYYVPDKVNGDLESRSSKLDKESKKPDAKIEISTKPPVIFTTTTAPAKTTTTTPKPNRNYNINNSESSKIFSQNSPNQKQQAAVTVPSIKYRLTQTQNGRTQIFPQTTPSTTTTTSTTTEKIPDGFNGKIDEKKYQTRFLPSKHLNTTTDDTNLKNPDTYVTVTKSVSGSLDNSKQPAEDNKFASTYYTKSSTCGYFTFSCNIVYGSNGRSKICRPKSPNNGKC